MIWVRCYVCSTADFFFLHIYVFGHDWYHCTTAIKSDSTRKQMESELRSRLQTFGKGLALICTLCFHLHKNTSACSQTTAVFFATRFLLLCIERIAAAFRQPIFFSATKTGDVCSFFVSMLLLVGEKHKAHKKRQIIILGWFGFVPTFAVQQTSFSCISTFSDSIDTNA